MDFSTSGMFAYNAKKKRLNGIFTIAIVVFFGLIVGLYFKFFHSTDTGFTKLISQIVSHVLTNIFQEPTLLGVFYGALFGGLFFIFMPVEALFVSFMKIGSPVLIFLIFISGFIISYSLNYYIGLKFSKITKAIITPKKFYKLKGVLNRWGGFAIFFINALPLPSQPLSAILGVFRYNLTRFYVYFLLGQISKYLVIIFIYGVIR